MNRLLGYEPYKGFQIHTFSKEATDIFGHKYEGYQGWAKRPSDNKCIDGGVVHETIEEAEDEMRCAINMIITLEQKKPKNHQ